MGLRRGVGFYIIADFIFEIFDIFRKGSKCGVVVTCSPRV
jgi:hypothetical protein